MAKKSNNEVPQKQSLQQDDTSIYQNIRTVLVSARQKAYSAVNSAMVEAYWEIGRQIEQAVGNRAEYGKGLLQDISKKLSSEFGRGFTVRNLQAMRQFFVTFPNTHALRAELSWTHYRLLMKIDNVPRREFYLIYMLYLPTEEELKRELERERQLIESKLIEDSLTEFEDG